MKNTTALLNTQKKKGTIWSAVVVLLLTAVVFSIPVQRQPVFIFGYAPIIVSSSSMSPTYHTNCFVIIKRVPFSEVNAGDVILFKSDALNGKPAMHRVVRVTDSGVITKGDANENEDNQLINADTFLGKSIFSSNALSYLNSFFSSKIYLFFLLTSCLIIFYSTFKQKKAFFKK